MNLSVNFIKIKSNALTPTYATDSSSGLDLFALTLDSKDLILNSGQSDIINTGIALEIPAGFEGQIRPRSGIAFHYNVTVLNAPGTIDSDYRGEIKVILINLGDNPFIIKHHMRIAQLVIAPVARVKLLEQKNLSSSTNRGAHGFGSTGYL